MTRNVARQRSLPTPRTEGMKNVLEATLRLLETTNPKDVTLRDVARESGHGPRLIIEWFGGKGGLFAAVFEKVFRDLTETGALFFADVATRTEVRVAFQVFNYMQLNHRDLVLSLRDRVVINRLQERLRANLGLSEEAASLTARRLAVLVVGTAVFRDYFDLDDDEVIAMIQDEFRATTGMTLPVNPNLPSSNH